MKKRMITAVLALMIATILALTSCPASPPLDPATEFKPYLAPEEPFNVVATNGYANSISLKWDNVEDATSYQVWATPVDQYGTVTKTTSDTETYSKLIARGFELIDIVTEPSCKLRELDSNAAYIFSVVAMKATKSTKGTTVLYSEPSSFVEGATFGEITMSAMANSKMITLFWNISNLYSILNDSNDLEEKETLYNYNVAIYKKLSSSSDWGEGKKLTSEEAKKQSYSFEASTLKIDTPYDFKLRLEILNEDGKIVNTVESSAFTITTDSAMTPSSVENVVATNGVSRHEVTLTWTIPQLAEQEELTSQFIIQRAVMSSNLSSNSWKKITSEVVQNEDGTYSVTDSTLEDNTIYIYRIINGYQIGTKTPIYQVEEDATTIDGVYSMWMPQDVYFTFIPSSDNKTGKLTVSYTYNPPKTNPRGTIKCYIGGSWWTERDLSSHTALEKQEVDSIEPTYSVSIINIRPLTYYSFNFTFTRNDEELLNITSPNEFTLGETGASDLIENLTASNDWVKAICLTWDETSKMEEFKEEGQTFVYEIYEDNVKLNDVEIKGDGSSKTAYIACEDGVSHNYRIKVASEDGLIFEVEESRGTTLAVPTELDATKGTSVSEITVTWPQSDNENVSYTLKYSYDGTSWEVLDPNTQDDSGMQIGMASLPAKTYLNDGNFVSFKLIVSNAEQLNSGLVSGTDTFSLESEIETGCVLGTALLNVRVENNGLDPDKITIKWDKVVGAHHYIIMRDNALKELGDVDTYEDNVNTILALSAKGSLNASYTYTVIPCLEDGTQVTISDSSTTARATGKLFAPPANVFATKGQSGITLTWSAVENATSYQIQKYVVTLKNGKVTGDPVESGDVITVASTGSSTETYEEKEQALLSGNVLYKIRSVREDGTVISQWQKDYENVFNSLGFDEAANIGYKLQNVSDSFEIKSAKNGNYYADYTVVSWYMVPGATSYTIKSYTSGSYLGKTLVGTTIINVSDLDYSGTDSNSVDNGKSSTQVGYLSYDLDNNKYTYNDGNFDFEDSYVITYYEIIANNGSVQSGTTNKNVTVYKQPTAKDWVNIVLYILKPAFEAANNSFGGDWWLGSFNEGSYTYPNTGMKFTLSGSASYNNDKNYLEISSYTDSNTKLTLSTTSKICFDVTSGGGAGYLGTDPLSKIGYNNNGIISVTPSDSELKSFTIQFKNVSVTSSPGGEFYVTITNGGSSTVSDNDVSTAVLGIR